MLLRGDQGPALTALHPLSAWFVRAGSCARFLQELKQCREHDKQAAQEPS